MSTADVLTHLLNIILGPPLVNRLDFFPPPHIATLDTTCLMVNFPRERSLS